MASLFFYNLPSRKDLFKNAKRVHSSGKEETISDTQVDFRVFLKVLPRPIGFVDFREVHKEIKGARSRQKGAD